MSVIELKKYLYYPGGIEIIIYRRDFFCYIGFILVG